ncbi:MAG: hypothetical protein AB1410_08620 [Acidobacteriota bacterium]
MAGLNRNRWPLWIGIYIDGPKCEHDKNRIYKNGRGTYDKILKNLEILKSDYPDYFERNVSFNAVYNANSNLDNVINFFATLKTEFAPNLRVRFSFDPISKIECKDSKTEYSKKVDTIKDDYIKIKKTMSKQSNQESVYHILSSFLAPYFYPIKTRTYLKPSCINYTGVICKPGISKIFVDVYGNFHICEQIDNTFEIGNCLEGLCYDSVKEIYDDYKRAILWECQNCIARNFCTICFVPVGKNGKFKKNTICQKKRISFLNLLEEYYSIMEDLPIAFDELKLIEL